MKALFVAITLVVLAASPWRAEALASPDGAMTALVYQPWSRDLDMGAEAWRSCFSRMKAMNIRTLYIQWMRHGPTDFMTARTASGQPFAPILFDSAAACGIELRPGLYHDPNYFTQIKQPVETRTSYLHHLRAQSLTTAKKIAETFGRHPAFGGWYLPEEIDDRNWRSSKKQDLLTDHLACLAGQLGQLTPGAPVAVSTFFTGQMIPYDYARMWETALERTGLVLLVQDGAGAGDLPSRDRALYLRALESRLGPRHPWGVIVELFEPTGSATHFSARPAPMTRVRAQVQAVSVHSPHAFVVGFSLRYLLFDGRMLGDES